MVGIAIPLYDEAYELLKDFQFEKQQGFRHYCGEIFEKPVSIFLTKPHISSASSLRAWLRFHNFSMVVLSGFCGALTSKQKFGQSFAMQKVSCHCNQTVFFPFVPNSFSKAHIHSVSKVVSSLEDKENIHLNNQANLVDMESWRFLELFNSSKNKSHINPHCQPIVMKIVGDQYNDEKWLKKEFYFRDFFRQKKVHFKIKIIFKTGVFSSIKLYRGKRFLQRQLKKEIYRLVQVTKKKRELCPL